MDWRSEESKKLFYHLEKKLGIEITFISLLSGEFSVNEDLYAINAFIDEINLKTLMQNQIAMILIIALIK